MKRYFTFAFEETSRSLEETVECIHQSVKDSVAYHKIADVEVGSFLSGGVDSSYIASVRIKHILLVLKYKGLMKRPMLEIYVRHYI